MMDARDLVDQLEHWARERPHRQAIHGKVNGHWRSRTWKEYWQAVRETAKGLIALGQQRGECVAIVGANRMEWVICQFGIMAAGGIPAPSYPTNTIEQVAHILRNSQARIAIADSRQLLDNYRAAALANDDLEMPTLIAMLDDEDEEAMTLGALRAPLR
jgi:long-chain acyl-CoA synthetase